MHKQPQEAIDYFSYIIDDILKNIFTFTDERSLLVMARVSKRFQTLIKKLLMDPSGVSNFQKANPNLRWLMSFGQNLDNYQLEFRSRTIQLWLESERKQLLKLQSELKELINHFKEQGRDEKSLATLSQLQQNLRAYDKPLGCGSLYQLSPRGSLAILIVYILAATYVVVSSIYASIYHHERSNILDMLSKLNSTSINGEKPECINNATLIENTFTNDFAQCLSLLTEYRRLTAGFMGLTITDGLVFLLGVTLAIGVIMGRDKHTNKQNVQARFLSNKDKELWLTIKHSYAALITDQPVETILDTVNFVDKAIELENNKTISSGETETLVTEIDEAVKSINQQITNQKYSLKFNQQSKTLFFDKINAHLKSQLSANQQEHKIDILSIEENEIETQEIHPLLPNRV